VLEVQTLFLVETMITAFLAVILGMMLLSLPKYRWLYYWFWENVLFTIAFLLFWKQTELSPFFGIFLPTFMASLSMTLILAGIDLLIARKPRLFLYFFFPLANIVLLVLTVLVQDRFVIRNLFLSLLIGSTFWLASHALLTRLPEKHKAPRVLTGVLGVLMGGAFILRIPLMLLGPGGIAAWTREDNWRYTLVAMIVTSLGFGVGLLMMTAAAVQTRLESSVIQLTRVRDDRERLLSILSHDLRGSVGLIEQMLGFFVKKDAGKLPDDAADFLRRLHTLSKEQRELLSCVLDWLRLQKGTIRPRKEHVSAARIMEELLSSFGETANSGKLDLDYSVPEEFALETDPELLITILRNLISNAMKFSLSGGKVRLIAERDSGEAVFRVVDDGIDFDAEQNGTAGDMDGENAIGLGLQIYTDFASRLGGSLKLVRLKGRITEAVLRLPIQDIPSGGPA